MTATLCGAPVVAEGSAANADGPVASTAAPVANAEGPAPTSSTSPPSPPPPASGRRPVLRADLPASISVFLIALPLSLGIA
ncbi:hypothetical protein, partial [Streptomyces sp. NPDC057675]|uniref:hypothetical protein n=1 Tax=Streptomyces sp. NPDC057675 TaxID=3346204 RepID=UPI00368FD840